MSAFQKMTKVAARSGAALCCALAAVATVGCGSARHTHTVEARGSSRRLLQEERPAPVATAETAPAERARPVEKDFGARYATPAQCEVAARKRLLSSRDEGWAALKSCVEQMHFTLLDALLSDAWAEELRVRPDAAQVIAQVVAKRGGSVDGELKLLHERKVPIFGLSAAIAQPDIYKGRYLLLRAQVADVRSEGDRPTVWLVEQALGSVESDQPVGYSTRKDTASVHSGAVNGDAGLLGRANLGGQIGTSEREQSSLTVRRFDNVTDETGREALGRLPKADPFFAPGSDFVVLARFDGLRTTSGGDEEEDEAAPKLPVLTIVGYYAPHPLIVY
ncbi:hypothetical protein [Vitiosangium sp. GDMCC 1.1324]|uniref:hypothetical protein n=1 Tax=Vitiosangium sp. (strain GDMCC 1.1324) TaxID=2138576 RepID=UPI000D35B43F|nr:hypothetical protein [Vitiosangium sp. GDMCC 1.1324]PTL85292.1 hypothetical protein DAT35_00785 [Vitiosangium sp. GDMCC 1.1324]